MTRTTTWALCAAVLVPLLGSAPVGAALDLQHTTYLTFSAPVALPGAMLPAGDYIFQVASPMTSANAVLVRSRDSRHVFYMGLTRQVERSGSGGTSITLGESAAGTPPPIRAWFPEGARTGHEFIYP
jgi:hypothetical protein